MDRFGGETLQGASPESTLLFALLVALLLIQGLARVMNPGYWQELFHSLISLNYISLMLREGKLRWTLTNATLDILFLLSATLYIEEALSLARIDPPFWQTLAGVVGFFGGQLLLALLVGYAFYTIRYIYPFVLNMIVFNRVLGIVLLPLVVIIVYGGLLPTEAWVIGVGSIGISFLIFRAIRALFQMQGLLQHGIIYNFCYLCMIELAPLILVIDRILALI